VPKPRPEISAQASPGPDPPLMQGRKRLAQKQRVCSGMDERELGQAVERNGEPEQRAQCAPHEGDGGDRSHQRNAELLRAPLRVGTLEAQLPIPSHSFCYSPKSIHHLMALEFSLKQVGGLLGEPKRSSRMYRHSSIGLSTTVQERDDTRP
jgi:hypothetical protein